jgi:pimeloyl-ACP methyl ester carboxylesterase
MSFISMSFLMLFIFVQYCFSINDIKESNMNEMIVKFNNVDICTESYGNSSDPCILLIMGASASMIWWDSEFCERLAGKGRFVIRYDNRDVGRSTCYESSNPLYNVIDMADDALRVLNAYKIKKAHFVGMSLGGMIAQLVAIRKPERVLTITLISSSVWDDIPTLPQIDKKILDYHLSTASLDWSNQEAVIKYMVGGWRLLNGSKNKFDENKAYKLAETEVKRANNLLSMFNHAMIKGGEDLYGKSKDIKLPVLIIHGTEDPVLPYAHAENLKKTIQNSKLISLEGSGHEIPFAEWDKIIKTIVEHTNSIK